METDTVNDDPKEELKCEDPQESPEDVEKKDRLKELQKWWEIPAIAHFCSLFKAVFGFGDFDIEDLEEALITSPARGGSTLVLDIICQLLNGCYARNDIKYFNYDLFLKDIFKQRWQVELGRASPVVSCNFLELSVRERVVVLHALCDMRLDADDVADMLKGLSGDSLRVDPLGVDGKGSKYWYFYGTRLYKELPDQEELDFQKSLKKGRQSSKRKVVAEKESEEEDEGHEDVDDNCEEEEGNASGNMERLKRNPSLTVTKPCATDDAGGDEENDDDVNEDLEVCEVEDIQDVEEAVIEDEDDACVGDEMDESDDVEEAISDFEDELMNMKKKKTPTKKKPKQTSRQKSVPDKESEMIPNEEEDEDASAAKTLPQTIEDVIASKSKKKSRSRSRSKGKGKGRTAPNRSTSRDTAKSEDSGENVTQKRKRMKKEIIEPTPRRKSRRRGGGGDDEKTDEDLLAAAATSQSELKRLAIDGFQNQLTFGRRSRSRGAAKDGSSDSLAEVENIQEKCENIAEHSVQNDLEEDMPPTIQVEGVWKPPELDDSEISLVPPTIENCVNSDCTMVEDDAQNGSETNVIQQCNKIENPDVVVAGLHIHETLDQGEGQAAEDGKTKGMRRLPEKEELTQAFQKLSHIASSMFKSKKEESKKALKSEDEEVSHSEVGGPVDQIIKLRGEKECQGGDEESHPEIGLEKTGPEDDTQHSVVTAMDATEACVTEPEVEEISSARLAEKEKLLQSLNMIPNPKECNSPVPVTAKEACGDKDEVSAAINGDDSVQATLVVDMNDPTTCSDPHIPENAAGTTSRSSRKSSRRKSLPHRRRHQNDKETSAEQEEEEVMSQCVQNSEDTTPFKSSDSAPENADNAAKIQASEKAKTNDFECNEVHESTGDVTDNAASGSDLNCTVKYEKAADDQSEIKEKVEMPIDDETSETGHKKKASGNAESVNEKNTNCSEHDRVGSESSGNEKSAEVLCNKKSEEERCKGNETVSNAGNDMETEKVEENSEESKKIISEEPKKLHTEERMDAEEEDDDDDGAAIIDLDEIVDDGTQDKPEDNVVDDEEKMPDLSVGEWRIPPGDAEWQTKPNELNEQEGEGGEEHGPPQITDELCPESQNASGVDRPVSPSKDIGGSVVASDVNGESVNEVQHSDKKTTGVSLVEEEEAMDLSMPPKHKGHSGSKSSSEEQGESKKDNSNRDEVDGVVARGDEQTAGAEKTDEGSSDNTVVHISGGGKSSESTVGVSKESGDDSDVVHVSEGETSATATTTSIESKSNEFETVAPVEPGESVDGVLPEQKDDCGEEHSEEKKHSIDKTDDLKSQNLEGKDEKTSHDERRVQNGAEGSEVEQADKGTVQEKKLCDPNEQLEDSGAMDLSQKRKTEDQNASGQQLENVPEASGCDAVSEEDEMEIDVVMLEEEEEEEEEMEEQSGVGGDKTETENVKEEGDNERVSDKNVVKGVLDAVLSKVDQSSQQSEVVAEKSKQTSAAQTKSEDNTSNEETGPKEKAGGSEGEDPVISEGNSGDVDKGCENQNVEPKSSESAPKNVEPKSSESAPKNVESKEIVVADEKGDDDKKVDGSEGVREKADECESEKIKSDGKNEMVKEAEEVKTSEETAGEKAEEDCLTEKEASDIIEEEVTKAAEEEAKEMIKEVDNAIDEEAEDMIKAEVKTATVEDVNKTLAEVNEAIDEEADCIIEDEVNGTLQKEVKETIQNFNQALEEETEEMIAEEVDRATKEDVTKTVEEYEKATEEEADEVISFIVHEVTKENVNETIEEYKTATEEEADEVISFIVHEVTKENVNETIEEYKTATEEEADQIIEQVVSEVTKEDMNAVIEEYKAATEQEASEILEEVIHNMAEENMIETIEEYVRATEDEAKDILEEVVHEEMTEHMKATVEEYKAAIQEEASEILEEVILEISKEEMNEAIEEYKKATVEEADQILEEVIHVDMCVDMKEAIEEYERVTEAEIDEIVEEIVCTITEENVKETVEEYKKAVDEEADQILEEVTHRLSVESMNETIEEYTLAMEEETSDILEEVVQEATQEDVNEAIELMKASIDDEANEIIDEEVGKALVEDLTHTIEEYTEATEGEGNDILEEEVQKAIKEELEVTIKTEVKLKEEMKQEFDENSLLVKPAVDESKTKQLLTPDEVPLYPDGNEKFSTKPDSRWELVCDDMEQWTALSQELKASYKERQLAKIIKEDFLPVMPSIIADMETAKERRAKEMMPRRSSYRLELMKLEDEEHERQKREAEEEEEKHRAVLEEERRQLMKEEEERKQREDREKARQERAKRAQLREERAQLIAEGKEIPPELMNGLKQDESGDQDDAEELIYTLRRVLDNLKDKEFSWPFWEAVEENNTSDYFDVISEPMDLLRIERRLEERAYKDVYEFERQVNLVFDNCLEYHGKDSDFGYMAENLKGIFERSMRRAFRVYVDTPPSRPSSRAVRDNRPSAYDFNFLPCGSGGGTRKSFRRPNYKEDSDSDEEKKGKVLYPSGRKWGELPESERRNKDDPDFKPEKEDEDGQLRPRATWSYRRELLGMDASNFESYIPGKKPKSENGTPDPPVRKHVDLSKFAGAKFRYAEEVINLKSRSMPKLVINEYVKKPKAPKPPVAVTQPAAPAVKPGVKVVKISKAEYEKLLAEKKITIVDGNSPSGQKIKLQAGLQLKAATVNPATLNTQQQQQLQQQQQQPSVASTTAVQPQDQQQQQQEEEKPTTSSSVPPAPPSPSSSSKEGEDKSPKTETDSSSKDTVKEESLSTSNISNTPQKEESASSSTSSVVASPLSKKKIDPYALSAGADIKTRLREIKGRMQSKLKSTEKIEAVYENSKVINGETIFNVAPHKMGTEIHSPFGTPRRRSFAQASKYMDPAAQRFAVEMERRQRGELEGYMGMLDVPPVQKESRWKEEEEDEDNSDEGETEPPKKKVRFVDECGAEENEEERMKVAELNQQLWEAADSSERKAGVKGDDKSSPSSSSPYKTSSSSSSPFKAPKSIYEKWGSKAKRTMEEAGLYKDNSSPSSEPPAKSAKGMDSILKPPRPAKKEYTMLHAYRPSKKRPKKNSSSSEIKEDEGLEPDDPNPTPNMDGVEESGKGKEDHMEESLNNVVRNSTTDGSGVTFSRDSITEEYSGVEEKGPNVSSSSSSSSTLLSSSSSSSPLSSSSPSVQKSSNSSPTTSETLPPSLKVGDPSSASSSSPSSSSAATAASVLPQSSSSSSSSSLSSEKNSSSSSCNTHQNNSTSSSSSSSSNLLNLATNSTTQKLKSPEEEIPSHIDSPGPLSPPELEPVEPFYPQQQQQHLHNKKHQQPHHASPSQNHADDDSTAVTPHTTTSGASHVEEEEEEEMKAEEGGEEEEAAPCLDNIEQNNDVVGNVGNDDNGDNIDDNSEMPVLVPDQFPPPEPQLSSSSTTDR